MRILVLLILFTFVFSQPTFAKKSMQQKSVEMNAMLAKCLELKDVNLFKKCAKKVISAYESRKTKYQSYETGTQKSHNKSKITPLHKAADKGDVALASSLIKKGANVNARDWLGTTPLYWAAYKGHVEVSELLLKHGANVNEKADHGTHFGRTPLHRAAQNGHTKLTTFLISKGADVKAQDENKDTPLHRAVIEKHIGPIKLLLKSGANINAINRFGWTPLDIAKDSKYTEIEKLLITHGGKTSAELKLNSKKKKAYQSLGNGQ